MLKQVVGKTLQATASLPSCSDVTTLDRLVSERHALVDLATAMAHVSDVDTAQLLLKLALPQLKVRDETKSERMRSINEMGSEGFEKQDD